MAGESIEVYRIPRPSPLFRFALTCVAVAALAFALRAAFGTTTDGSFSRNTGFGDVATGVGALSAFLAFLTLLMTAISASLVPSRMWIEGGRLRASRKLPAEGLAPGEIELRGAPIVGLLAWLVSAILRRDGVVISWRDERGKKRSVGLLNLHMGRQRFREAKAGLLAFAAPAG